MSSLPLSGRRVLVTRAAHQAGKLSQGLRAVGAEPVEVPVLEIQPPASFDLLDAAIDSVQAYDWLILTSANTVRALVERSASRKIPMERFARIPVAAVGESTASAARGAGFNVTFVPESYVAESLVSRFPTTSQGQKILLARAAVARDLIPDALRAAGARVDVVDAYRNVLPSSAPGLLRKALSTGIDAVTFTSSSSVTHLAEAAVAAGIPWPLAGVPSISIGPITSRTLLDQGWQPAAEAAVSDIPGLIAAIVLYFDGSSPGGQLSFR